MDARPRVVFSFFGSRRDLRSSPFRPTLSLCSAPREWPVAQLVLLREPRDEHATRELIEDVRAASPKTAVQEVPFSVRDPWDVEEVLGSLYEQLLRYPFDPERQDYFAHLSTGTHAAIVALFLLTKSRHLPGRLVSSVPPDLRGGPLKRESIRIAEPDLSRYLQVEARRRSEELRGVELLKASIDTRNESYNALMERILRVALRADTPMLLTGPTGAGKTALASRIYKLKKDERKLTGAFVELNCATLTRDSAHSALFGHAKGAFTGAVAARAGALKSAQGGLLFLDEVGELAPDIQAMLLTALETGCFLPLGMDTPARSSFQLVAGTNRDLSRCVREGTFREDLFARLRRWTFHLLGLADRREDIPPNIDYEIAKWPERITFARDARAHFEAWALSASTPWPGNFRDLSCILERLFTLAAGGQVSLDDVKREIAVLEQDWNAGAADARDDAQLLKRHVSAERLATLDAIDRVTLAHALHVCTTTDGLADAGRILFDATLRLSPNPNPTDRVRKFLLRHGVNPTSLASRSRRNDALRRPPRL